VRDDQDGHLIYVPGDLLLSKCTHQTQINTRNSQLIIKLFHNQKDTWRRNFRQSGPSQGHSRVHKTLLILLLTQLNHHLTPIFSSEGSRIALKIIKNVDKYREAARLEIKVLKKIKSI
jgi:hypothetical protein